MTFEQVLPYIIPPLLGALIGYVTNYIAIRMLFRPLKPWRFLGVRIPMTPGIIPGKRGELARKMGEMVGEHLLTAADVGNALEKEGIRRELRSAVTEKLGRFLDRDLGPLESLIPDRFRRRFRDLVDLLRWKTVKLVFDYLGSDSFETKLRDYLQREGDQLLARDLSSYLTPERYRELQEHLDRKLSGFLTSPAVAEGVGVFVDRKTEGWISSDRPLREHVAAVERDRDRQRRLVLDLDHGQPARVGHAEHPLHDVAVRHAYPRLGHRRAVETHLPHRRFLGGHVPAIVGRDEPVERGTAPGFDATPRGDRGAPGRTRDSGGDHVISRIRSCWCGSSAP